MLHSYDIFIDAVKGPTDRNSNIEIMIWVEYTVNEPLADSYDANGEAVPWATNMNIGEKWWDVSCISIPVS
jgi:hypothetical protein